MTHQDLLDKLAYTPHTDPNGKYMYQALRAIVELHKPIVVELLDGPGPMCNNCCDGFYPCLTIQIIEHKLEKELT